MVKFISKFLLVSFLCVMVGCSSVAYIKTDDEPTASFSPTKADGIKVYAVPRLDAEYLVLGEVIADADAGSDATIAVNFLKKQAAKLGADAIINLRLEIDSGYWLSAIKASGTAIKFK